MRIYTTALYATIALFFLSPVVAQAQSNPVAQENFAEADANSDAQLTYPEFVTFIDLNAADGLGNAQRVSSRGLHARAFSRADANGDGMVTTSELQAL